jgi:signal transduction histidine kinase
MRTFALKTQFGIIVAFLAVFAMGASVSSFVRSRSESDLTGVFHADLAIATKLPKLKSLLRSLDLATAQYLKTGNDDWLVERQDILEKTRKTQEDLAQLVSEPRERKILDELRQRLSERFMQESRWIRARKAGRLSASQAARILAERSGYEDILEIALDMHDVKVQDLRGRVEDARRSSRRGFVVVLGVGLLASAMLAYILSRYIIEPIRKLDEYARGWRPGQPWACTAPAVSPEINSLFQRMRDLMESLNEELRKQRDIGQLKSQLVSTVSHELNNSLSVIHAVSVNLEETDRTVLDEKRAKMYGILKGHSLTLSRVISNLLNLGRLESGRLSLEKKEMDVQLILKSSLDLMEILYKNKNLAVSLQAQGLTLPVFADPEALTLVVTNLLSNAIKYTPEGGAIVVGCERDQSHPGYAQIFVKDTGIGVSPQDKERIFSGHYRSKEGQKMAKGFGIGLSLAKSIIEAHGGRMDLESEPGRGSKFFFSLPLWNPRGGGNPEGGSFKTLNAEEELNHV